MKAILVDDMIEMKVVDVYNGEAYPKKDGLYMVDDGTMYYFVTVSYDISISTNMVMANPLPRKAIIKEYERNDDSVQKQLAELNKGIKEIIHITNQIDIDNIDDKIVDTINEFETSLVQKITAINTKSDVDLAGLTKLIAVAQKPDLLKGK